MTSATMASMDGLGGSNEDRAAQQVERMTWRDVAVRYWSSATEESALEPHKKTPQLKRTKALEWLVATSHQLTIATGSNWERFVQVEDPGKREDPMKWPCVSVCIDQGSDGWSASHYLKARGANLLLTFDWNHRLEPSCLERLLVANC